MKNSSNQLRKALRRASAGKTGRSEELLIVAAGSRRPGWTATFISRCRLIIASWTRPNLIMTPCMARVDEDCRALLLDLREEDLQRYWAGLPLFNPTDRQNG